MINCLRSSRPEYVELEKLEARCGVQQFRGIADDGHTAVYSGRCVQNKRPGAVVGIHRLHGGNHRSEDGYTWEQNAEWDFWFDYTEDDFLVRENKERFRRA